MPQPMRRSASQSMIHSAGMILVYLINQISIESNFLAKRAKHLWKNGFRLFVGAIQICRTESNVVKEHGKKMNGTIS